jgi:hypothetical protein
MKPQAMTAAVLAVLLFACLTLTGQTDPWIILPAGRTGSAITNKTSEGDLKRIYGSQNVTTEKIEVEGALYEFTILFSRDPQRRLRISYTDAEKLHPQEVLITGNKSVWQTIHNVSVGMTLKELEAINTRPFRVGCFCTDQPGVIWSFEQGSLAEFDRQPYKVWLQLDEDCHPNKAAFLQIFNKGGLSSQPAFQVLNPCVDSIKVQFPLVR